MKPDLKLREAVFRKMGWYLNEYGNWCSDEYPSEIPFIDSSSDEPLPPIETTWEVCAEYLVPFMREKNYVYFFTERTFSWIERIEAKSIPNISQAEPQEINMSRSSDVKNDNIALAACQAFIMYFYERMFS